MWFRDDNFNSLVSKWWKDLLIGMGKKAFIFFKKLKFLKGQIKEWNISQFGNIFEQKIKLEKELESLNNKVIQSSMDNMEFQVEKVLKVEYIKVLAREEIF